MEPIFKHYDLKLVVPAFDSPLTDLIIELDYLRRKRLSGTTYPSVFFPLKQVFHFLESIGSARIEGNSTTIAEYVEAKLDEKKVQSPKIQEIQNMEKAMAFIDEMIKDHPINRSFVSELHKMVVDGLPPGDEGDVTPGVYRTRPVKISRSTHLPPEPSTIGGYMDELFAFINRKDSPKYDLLKTAIAHHRFVWIHPFNNGNGRTVRLFTYAMLVKQGFNVDVGRILNPTAVFCNNRENYYHFLSYADMGTEEGTLSWCEYVLKGLKEEIEKIDRLLDYDYLKNEILLPSIRYSLDRQNITELEAKILKRAVEKQVLQAGDIKEFFEGKHAVEISRNIARLKEKKMLVPIRESSRKYVLRFDNNFLLRGIIKTLDEKGFLPLKGEV